MEGLLTIFWFVNTSCGGKVQASWGFVILSYPSRHLPTTSFILLVNTLLLLSFTIVFCALRHRWVIPLPPLQNPAFTNPDSSFFHIRTVFIRFPSLEFWEIVVFGNVVFLKYSTMLVTRTRDGEFYGRNTRPSLFLFWHPHPW